MKKNKILFIAYYFPPRGTVGSLRTYRIAQHFGDFFLSVDVVSTKETVMPLGDELPMDKLRLHRVSHTDYRNVLSSKGKGLRSGLNQKSNSFWVKSFRRFLDSFPFNLLIGEGGLRYIWNAYQEGKRLIRANEITHIYTSFRPYADHFVGYLLKRRFSNLYWMADFRDLHIDVHRNNVYFPCFQKRIDQFLLKKADIVSTVSEGLRKNLMHLHPKVVHLSTGIHGLFSQKPMNSSPFLSLTYTGSFYPEYQNISPLLDAIKTLRINEYKGVDDLRLIYAGKDEAIWNRCIYEYGLETLNISKGMLQLSEAVKLQFESQINILLSWSSDNAQGIITGKFYEYLNAGRPIWLLLNGEYDSELERLFSELQCGEIIYLKNNNAKDTLISLLKNVIQSWTENGHIAHQMNEAAFKQLDWSTIVETFLKDNGIIID